MDHGRKSGFERLLAPFTETFGLNRATATAAVLLIGLVVLASTFWFIHSAPPKTIIMTTGAPGSSFETNAQRYAQILARSGVTLKLLPSQGSLENLDRLNNPSFHVDIGFVQGGMTNASNPRNLSSLGSISYQPLMVFYRNAKPVALLSELKGKRLAIGPVGSGTRLMALKILQLNQIEPGDSTTLLDLESEKAAQALIDGRVDAVFLMGDSASPRIMGQLLRTASVQILNFTQADGYARKVNYLNKLELPKGSIDFGRNIPAEDIFLIGPTLEILARPNLHPALVDLLLEAAKEVHGRAGLFKRKEEFPSPIEGDFPINVEATRFYTSGKSFLYRSLPFWLASLVNRILVAFVPMVVVMIPTMRAIPWFYKLRIRLRIYRWYRALLALERDLFVKMTLEQQEQSLARIDHIEAGVNRLKVPASFADQFYALRGYIGLVRNRIANRSVKDAPVR